MKTYIQKDVEGLYIESEESFSNYGFSYDDFLNGRYIELSEDQINYHNDYPEADIVTIMNVSVYQNGEVIWHISDAPVTLESVKENKLSELSEYDNSDNVNDFTVNNEIHGWFTQEQRSNYKSSIESAKLLGIDELQVFIGNTLFTLSTSQAELMLAQIQMYADRCFIITKEHKLQIESLNTIEEVQNYNFTTNYPEKLNFTL